MPTKTVTVEATMSQGFTMECRAGDHTVYIDQPKATGGANKGPNPLQYLQISLAGCIGAIARIVASQKNLPLRGVKVKVAGTLNTDRLLGKDVDSRTGFDSLEAHVEIDADMSADEKQAFLAEIDKRCPISDNIAGATPISFHLMP